MIKNKKTNLVLFNDQALTDSYDFVALNDKDFMFICMQEDGEVWGHRFTSSRGPPPENSYTFQISPNQIGEYSK